MQNKHPENAGNTEKQSTSVKPPHSIAKAVAGVTLVASGAATIYGFFSGNPKGAVLAIIGMVFAIMLLGIVGRASHAISKSKSRFYDVLVKTFVTFILVFFMTLTVVLFPAFYRWIKSAFVEGGNHKDVGHTIQAGTNQIVTNAQTLSPPIDADRRTHLLEKFQKGNPEEQREALEALFPGSTSISALEKLLMDTNYWVASAAAFQLSKLPGQAPIELLRTTVSKTNSVARRSAVFTLGEMALFGRRAEVRPCVEDLRTALFEPQQTERLQEAIVHALAKIGGPRAMEILLSTLNSNAAPAHVQAYALHGCRKFAELEENFRTNALLRIKTWSPEQSRQVAQDSIFQYVDPTLKEAVRDKGLSGN